MKLKVIHRAEEDYTSSRPGDVARIHRNYDPSLHPFDRAREYVRALNATKMDKMFAKPLVKVFDGHTDSVKCMARGHASLTDLYTGSCDGEVRIWNMSSKGCDRSIRAHDGFVRGICSSFDDQWLFSCGDDKKIKQWPIEKNFGTSVIDMEEVNDSGNLVSNDEVSTAPLSRQVKPTAVFQGRSVLTSIDHHWSKPLLVTTGETVDVWDHNRSAALHSFEWGTEAVLSARFNPSEKNLIAATAGDNSIGLYDIRGNTPLRKVILKTRSNAIRWNPMEPMKFVVSNEDHNLYTFDSRKLESALCVHRDFQNAVLDVDYSPTGKEFVASSFDKTIRIFPAMERRSRDVYHTRRMQVVLCCCFSGDGRFVMSGSSDMCVRLWKSQGSAPLGPRSLQERRALAYRDSLKTKYAHLKEIRRIARWHHIPKRLKKAAETKREMEQSQKLKDENRRRHAKKQMPRKPERKKMIYGVME